LASYQVEIVSLPIRTCCFSLVDFIVRLNLCIVMLDVLIRHDVVFSWHIEFLELASFRL